MENGRGSRRDLELRQRGIRNATPVAPRTDDANGFVRIFDNTAPNLAVTNLARYPARCVSALASFRAPAQVLFSTLTSFIWVLLKNIQKPMHTFLSWKANLLPGVWELISMLQQEKVMLVFVVTGLWKFL